MVTSLAQPRHSYELLDGLRGVAAIAVAILHMPRVFGGYTLPNAHLAVDFFLQLSGFIVAYAYAPRITDGMTFRDFAARRFIRLYPAYVVGFILGFAVAIMALIFGGSGLSVDWTPAALLCAAVPNALMLPQAFCSVDGLLFPINPPMWSIFYELAINFAFFFAVAVLVVWRRSAILSVVLLALLLTTTFGRTLDIGYSWPTFLAGLVRMLFSFLVGVTIHGLRLRPRGKSSLISLVLVAALAIALGVQTDAYWYQLLATVVVFPVIVMTASLYNPTQPRVAWVFVQLGALSYLLYVIHKPLYQLVYGAILKVAPGVVDTLGAGLGVMLLAAIVGAAWLLARYYEPPARRLLDSVRSRAERVVVR